MTDSSNPQSSVAFPLHYNSGVVGLKKVLGQEVAIFSIQYSDSCKFRTEKIIDAQNFNFVYIYSQNKDFSRKFSIFVSKFFDKKIFRHR